MGTGENELPNCSISKAEFYWLPCGHLFLVYMICYNSLKKKKLAPVIFSILLTVIMLFNVGNAQGVMVTCSVFF